MSCVLYPLTCSFVYPPPRTHGRVSSRNDRNSLLVPRSGPGCQELPHLLEQESEGLCYIFAISFRLLGVLWPRHPCFGSSGGSGKLESGQAASSASVRSSSFSLWPERGAFELETTAPQASLHGVIGGQPHQQGSRHYHHQQQQQQQQQQRRLRPPRPGSATSGSGGGGGVAGGRSGRNGGGIGGNVPGGPVLVVDDLLEWNGEGDEGPVGVGGEGGGVVDEGEASRRDHDRRSSRAAEWDGTALGREFLRSEGTALLRRYFVADGEVQRGR